MASVDRHCSSAMRSIGTSSAGHTPWLATRMSSRPKCRDSLSHQRPRSFRSIQIGSDRVADARATFLGQRISLRPSAAITESNLGARRGEHPHRSRANAARTARNESNFAGERKRNGHRRVVSSFGSAVASGRDQSPEPDGVRSDRKPRSSNRTSMPSKRVPLIFESSSRACSGVRAAENDCSVTMLA